MAASFMGPLSISAWVAITRLATLKRLKRSKNNVFKKAKSYSTDDGSTGTESVERAALGFPRYVTYTFSVVEVKRAKIDRK